MWLLDTGTLELKEFIGTNVPPYAILSHTWGAAEDEVSFRDMRKARAAAELKKGYVKVKNCCEQAARDRYQYAWIDSCCIDKRSSAELSEAINSMYKYYQNAQVCYAYLADVPSSGVDLSIENDDDALSKSSWFKRGWTLQELIAPRIVRFFGVEWSKIGAKMRWDADALAENVSISDPFMLKLAKITGISRAVLWGLQVIEQTSVAQRMSWAARRQTTREEDAAYSLMGLFNTHMPILYGEGESAAFERLQLQIIQSIPDQSLFAWRANRETSGLLAKSPRDFADSSTIEIQHPWIRTAEPWSMTNIGLRINLRLSSYSNPQDEDIILGTLRCWTRIETTSGLPSERVRICLQRVRFKARSGSIIDDGNLFRRVHCDKFIPAYSRTNLGQSHDIFVLEDSHFKTLNYE